MKNKYELETEIELIQFAADNAMRLLKSDGELIVPMHRHKKALIVGSEELGVKEVPGVGNNPRIQEYFSYARKDNDMSKTFPDSVPWCAAYMAFVLEKAGMQSTNSLTARSYLQWGKSVINDPQPGDIVVYWRGSKTGWQGHVGFWIAENSKGDILTMGANQNDEVNCTWYGNSRLLDIRRSRKAPTYSNGMKLNLKELAEDIIQGRPLNVGGSVA